ncbi:ABZJ_00895 family protein [Acinetobacter indicus]
MCIGRATGQTWGFNETLFAAFGCGLQHCAGPAATMVLVYGLNLGVLTLFPTLVVVALINAKHFVKREKRLPTSDERIQLIWGSSAVAIIIGSLFIFFMVLMNPYAEQIIRSARENGTGPHGSVDAMYGRHPWCGILCRLRLVCRLLRQTVIVSRFSDTVKSNYPEVNSFVQMGDFRTARLRRKFNRMFSKPCFSSPETDMSSLVST